MPDRHLIAIDPTAVIRFDAALITAELRAIVARKRDLLTLFIGVPVLLLVGRSWISVWPDDRIFAASAVTSGMVSFVLLRGMLQRLHDHQAEGPIARHALPHAAQLSYVLTWVCAGQLLTLCLAMGLGIVSALAWILGAMLGSAGAAALNLTRGMLDLRIPGFSGFGGAQPLKLRTIALASFLTGLLIALASYADWVTESVASGLSGSLVLVACLLLGWVDHGSARYRLLVGHHPLAIILTNTAPPVICGLSIAAGLALAPDWTASLIVSVVSFACAIISAISTLVHCVYSRRLAEWALTAVLGLTAMTALAAPPLAPIVMLVAGGWLYLRAQQERWLLA